MAIWRPPDDIDRAHEQRIAAFLLKVPKRARERVEAKYQVLTEHEEKRVLKHESCWAGDLLDVIEISNGASATGGGLIPRTPAKTEPIFDLDW